MADSIQSDIQKVVNKLKRLPKDLQKKELKRILKKNAKTLVKKAKSNIPKASKPVHRYKDGKIVATYKPGNLRKSIRVLPLRRSKSVFVGPVTGGKRKIDGYYGHFMEFGNRFFQGIHYMEKAYKSTRYIVLAGIANDVRQSLNKYLRKNRIR